MKEIDEKTDRKRSVPEMWGTKVERSNRKHPGSVRGHL